MQRFSVRNARRHLDRAFAIRGDSEALYERDRRGGARRPFSHAVKLERLRGYSMATLWSTAGGADGLRRSKSSGMAQMDINISNLKSSI